MEIQLPQLLITILSVVFPLLASILMKKIQSPTVRAWVSFCICFAIGILATGMLGKLHFSDPVQLMTAGVYAFGCAMTAYKLLWEKMLGQNPQPPTPN